MSVSRMAVIRASSGSSDCVVTGLTLSERAKRVAIQAGVLSEHVYLVRNATDVGTVGDRLRASDVDGVLFLDAVDQVVAAPLVEPLELDKLGMRVSSQQGKFAGALVADKSEALVLLDRLAQNEYDGDLSFVTESGIAETVLVGERARHPASTKQEIASADAWQFELVNKPRDAFLCVRLYRPLARPLTRMFLRLPLSPNAISVLSATLSIGGCAVAAGASFHRHVLGLAILFLGGLVDCCDGEVARLRLEGSKLGAWLDAIGDDVARIALILAIGFHVAPQYPNLPILWATGGAVFLTLTSMMLIYWYCIFVAGSSNNQDYEAILGIGPGEQKPESMSLTRVLGDLGAAFARRDFIDLVALLLAIVSLSIATHVGFVIGSVIALGVVLPAHVKLVQSRRAGARP